MKLSCSAISCQEAFALKYDKDITEHSLNSLFCKNGGYNRKNLYPCSLLIVIYSNKWHIKNTLVMIIIYLILVILLTALLVAIIVDWVKHPEDYKAPPKRKKRRRKISTHQRGLPWMDPYRKRN